MKILHLNDQAGVSCVLAKYQNKLGNDVKVITVSDDKYGIYEYLSSLTVITLTSFPSNYS